MHNGKCQGHPLMWLICKRVDEFKDWANRADALASYAKQAGHDTLLRI
jgi:hypothetical protein